jgi:hypothetical protein
LDSQFISSHIRYDAFANQTARSVATSTALTDEVLGRRTSSGTQFADGLGQLKQVGWAAIFPVKAFREDKPWNLVWVRWLLLFSCIPCSLVYLSNTGHLDPDQTTFCIGIYAALFWVLGLFMVLKPEDVSIGKWFWFCGLPVLLGIVMLVIIVNVHFISSLYAARVSDSMLIRSSSDIGFSLLNQTFIGLPLFLSYVRKTQPDSSRTMAFWGFVAGLAFAFVPTIAALLDTRTSYWSGQSVAMLLRTSVLTGFLGGILGYFLAAAAQNKQLMIGFTVAGLLATSVIAGLTMAFSDSIIGWVLGIFTALMFVAHVRKEMAEHCV